MLFSITPYFSHILSRRTRKKEEGNEAEGEEEEEEEEETRVFLELINIFVRYFEFPGQCTFLSWARWPSD